MPLTKIQSLGITDGTIVNADINASAAIDGTKLSGVQGKFESALLHVRDEKTAGTHGGASSTGSFLIRTLNTVVTNEITGASLASDQITLPSGTYYVFAGVPVYGADNFKVKLRNTTDSSDTLIGGNDYDTARGLIIGRFTIAAQKVFEIQYRVATARATFGLGYAANFSTIEIYTDVQIWKVS